MVWNIYTLPTSLFCYLVKIMQILRRYELKGKHAYTFVKKGGIIFEEWKLRINIVDECLELCYLIVEKYKIWGLFKNSLMYALCKGWIWFEWIFYKNLITKWCYHIITQIISCFELKFYCFCSKFFFTETVTRRGSNVLI